MSILNLKMFLIFVGKLQNRTCFKSEHCTQKLLQCYNFSEIATFSMPPFIPYIDNGGRKYFMYEADQESPVQVWVSWWGWRPRICYLLGYRLFIAEDLKSTPYDMVNLIEPGVVITRVKGLTKDYCWIDGICGSKQRQYKIIFCKKTCDWWVHLLQQSVTMENLSRIDKVEPVQYPHKYLVVTFLLEWLLIKDLVHLDSSLCNHQYRSIFLYLVQEYCQQFSNKFFRFPLSIDVGVVNWILRRQLIATRINVRNCSLLNLLVERDLYAFSSILELVFDADTDSFYNLLRRCDNLTTLLVYSIKNKERFVCTVIVHNRKLIHASDPARYNNLDAMRLAFHHRCFSVVSNLQCDLVAFKAGLWYQKAPEILHLRTPNLSQIVEIMRRTNAVHTLSNNVLEGDIALLLQTQHLTAVNLLLSYSLNTTQCLSIPLYLSQCSSITDLNLTRNKFSSMNQQPLQPWDWSCFRDSQMRLKTLSLFMSDENILQYCSGVLSTAESITISNNVVTDEELLAVFEANHGRLKNLAIFYGHRLQGQFMAYIGLHCKRLENLSLQSLPEKVKRHYLLAYVSFGCKTLRCLSIPSRMWSEESTNYLKNAFPALRSLHLDCMNNALSKTDVQLILNGLGQQLIELGLRFASEEFHKDARVMALMIERCCEIV